MHPLTAKEVIRILEAYGFVHKRTRGSHYIFIHQQSGIMVPVPVHGKSTPIFIGTFMRIIEQSGLPKEAFLKK